MAGIDGDRARKVHSPRLYTILPLTLNEIVDWGSCGGAPLFDIKWRSGQETMPTCEYSPGVPAASRVRWWVGLACQWVRRRAALRAGCPKGVFVWRKALGHLGIPRVPLRPLPHQIAAGKGAKTAGATAPTAAATESHTPATPHSAHQVLCRDRNLRGARAIRLHILAGVFILIHLAAIGAEVGIIGSLNWSRGHRILRGNEGGGIRRRDSRGARRAALQWATRVGGTHRRGWMQQEGRARSHTGCGRQEDAVVLSKMAGQEYV